MGIMPRDVPLTRNEVAEWLIEFKKSEADKSHLKDFLIRKLRERELHEATVNTTAHQDLDNETALVDMILMDLDSYA